MKTVFVCLVFTNSPLPDLGRPLEIFAKDYENHQPSETRVSHTFMWRDSAEPRWFAGKRFIYTS